MGTKKPEVDQRLVRDLVAILDETNLTEIEIEQDDMRIRVSRQSGGVAQAQFGAPAATPNPAPAPPPAESTPAASAGSSNAVPSPMVGTAYAAPAPGARPFIEVGQSVREGQTLLVIEAMKTMNQIPSPRSGTITEILFEDARPVEYGEPLVIIE